MKVFLVYKYNSRYGDVLSKISEVVVTAGHTLTTHEDVLDIGPPEELVKDQIKSSDLVVVDVSKKEGNVNSEFAVARAFDKPIILITSSSDSHLEQYFSIFYDRLRLNDTLAIPLTNYFKKNKTKAAIKKSIETDKKTLKSVFVSYSHRDSNTIERLTVHLKPFIKSDQIDLWIDTKIKAGDQWRHEIDKALDKASMAILLISADFLASDFIIDNELPPLLKAAEEKGKRIIPIIVKPCRFTSTPVLNKFQSLNDPSYPLSKLNENDREEVYVKLADLVDDNLK